MGTGPSDGILACLARGRALLIERGWAQLGPTDRLGRLDLRCSLILASDGDDDVALAAIEAVYAAGARGGFETESGRRYGVEGWNDCASRTLREVLAVIDRATGETR